jgi:hypothetical protein
MTKIFSNGEPIASYGGDGQIDDIVRGLVCMDNNILVMKIDAA